uniref:Peptidase aspartic, active site n=1 Tax=Medicago truncatula TaxID=3880 RepID=A2Q455_MEDTR|nr:Peptidase aspartic, active site [Medicago truncatula]
MIRNNKDNRDRFPGGNSGGNNRARGMFNVGQNKTHTINTANWRDKNVRSLSSQEIADRRQKGLCFKCGGPYHPRHQCPDKNLSVMVLEDDSEDENEVRVLNDEDVDTGAEELQLNVLTFENALTFDRQTEYYQDRFQCIRFQGKVREIPVLMLVDSGANKNFMSRRLALALGLRITETPVRRIRLGDGHVVPTLGECHGVIISVQGVEWEIDVMLFELRGYDLVLGMAWLTQIGCTCIDWVEKKMRFDYQGEWIEIRGIRTRECTPLQNYVDENHFGQLHCDVQPGMVTPNQQLEMKSLLDNFDNIFKEPQGLPPGRQQEHAIHLLHGQGPVNVRPYRYPHHHKTEIEKQVKELLLSGVIRPSQSAFSSPVILVKKKDDSWRMCVDYRALNKVTIPDKFPIPVIDELLDELHGEKGKPVIWRVYQRRNKNKKINN